MITILLILIFLNICIIFFLDKIEKNIRLWLFNKEGKKDGDEWEEEFKEKDDVDKKEKDKTNTYEFEYIPNPSSPFSQNNHPQKFTLDLSKTTYETFTKMPRWDEIEGDLAYSKYVTKGICKEVYIAYRKIKSIAELLSLSRIEIVNLVLAFTTKAFPYELDSVTHGVPDYADYPMELLYEQVGDCEDHAILAAAIMKLFGYDVILLLLIGPDCGHIACGVSVSQYIQGTYIKHNSKKYFYCEATPHGTWYIGDLPSSVANWSITPIPIGDIEKL